MDFLYFRPVENAEKTDELSGRYKAVQYAATRYHLKQHFSHAILIVYNAKTVNHCGGCDAICEISMILYQVFPCCVMFCSSAAVFTTHPSFDKNASAFLTKSTFPYQGRRRRECHHRPYFVNQKRHHTLKLTSSPTERSHL